jgi:type II secretory pathway pseudopilin PulG
MAGKKNERPVIKREVHLHLADPNNTNIEELRQQEGEGYIENPLVKSMLTALNEGDERIQRLAFERDPTANNEYAAIFRQKIRLIPDFLLKRVSIQDDLVASIISARSNHISAFGRPQPDRFSLGFKVEPKEEIIERASKEQKEAITKRAAKFEEKLLSCGKQDGWVSEEKMSLSRFFSMQVRNYLVVGRFATEFLYELNDKGDEEFHSFRPVDGGTIYRAAPYKTSAEAVRKQAKRLMEQMLNRKLEEADLDNNEEEYPWVQVIEGKPVQVFKSKELYVHNAFPVTDVELQGYPLTPLDTVIAAVTTHINITTHNKLFFQSGRAAKGMLVIQSEDLTEPQVAKIRQQFQANINNVNNSWRMPVFSVGSKDNVQFQQIETTSRDMEFQYLSDMNARVILSAFGMSPEELPGYAHLSRGTNNQALAESNKEYQLEAHRDTGIRPMLAQFEDFLNVAVFPVMDEELSKICVIKLVGLDADSAEKEAVRIGTDAPLHMTYDEVLSKVEKDPIGKEFGGEFPLNPQFQMVLDKYMTVGQILEKFFGQKGAAQNPDLAYFRDPFWFQMQQMKQQAEQMKMQQQQQEQQAQQQAAQGGQPPQEGGGEGGPPPEDGGGGQPAEGQPTEKKEEGGDLTTGIDQLMGSLGKSEAQLPPSKRRLLAQQRKAITTIMDSWETDAKRAIGEILDVAEQHAPKQKG